MIRDNGRIELGLCRDQSGTAYSVWDPESDKDLARTEQALDGA